MESSDARNFNDAKHDRGEWNTTVLATRNRAVRLLADFLSYKRRGVDRLAAGASCKALALDAGAGTGAYSVWFAARSRCRVVSVDISFRALQKASYAALRSSVRMLPVCADLHALPFRPRQFGTVFSVDTLGHVANVNMVLDELSRCAAPGAYLFLHSECGDYRRRWPDRELIERLGRDVSAEEDGHGALVEARELFELYSRRFRLISFVNPAGFAGWCLGYPEKYRWAFAAAGMVGFARFLSLCAAIKAAPFFGIVVRLFNAVSNHVENFFGFSGGGSCFALVKKPE